MNNFVIRKNINRSVGQRLKYIVLLAIFAFALAAINASAVGAPPFTVGAPEAGRHKIKVNDPLVAQALVAQGGRLIADYGSFQIIEVPQISDELATNSQVEIHDEYNVVMLNAKHLDTTKPEVTALRSSLTSFSGKRMHLVHFAGPVQPQWRDELLAAGVQIVSYIPENAYLVYGDAPSIAKVQAIAASAPHIQWEGAYTADYKIHPKARTVDSKGNPRAVGTEWFAIQLLADSEANSNTVQLLDSLKLAPLQPSHTVLHYVNYIARLNPESLNQLAAQSDVVSIQPYFSPVPFCERQDQIVAGNISNNVPTGPGYLAWLASKGFTQAQFTASGFSVDVSDTGIDEGTLSPAHFGLHVAGNLSGASRMTYARFESTTNNTFTTLVGCDGHGTLNAHIVAGYDNSSNFPYADTNGFHYGLGVCPFVNVGSSVIFNADYSEFDTNYQNYPNFTTLQSQAYHSGARVSNNSWGYPSLEGVYDMNAQNFDALVRDAEPTGSVYPTAGNQEMVIVFAAGNSGASGAETVSSPATAKNVISVGAADSVQPFGGADKGGIGDSESSSANEIASFSSRGPCLDGRSKPDIMAPGTHISGGVAQWSAAIPNPAGTGTADPCFNASGVDGGPGGSSFFPANQQFYTASSGTSHAAPCVAGGAALIRQYFINNSNTPPSAAMTKAFLLNSARYLTGTTANDTLPSTKQGMGEMNLGTAFDGVPRILRDELSNDMFTASGQSRSYVGTIANTNQPFRVTFAWTDAPGSTTGSAYNNNLDLTVTANGNTYKGNVFSGQYSVPGGLADPRNNVESVFLPAGVGGGFVVKVNGTSINSIGVPNSSNALNQDFALVIYNANSNASPIIASAGTALISSGCNNGAINPGDLVTVSFALQNISTVNTTNVVATLQANSSIIPSGLQSASYGALLTNGAAVSQQFTFTANGPCGGNVVASFTLQDGAANLGTVNVTLPLGQFFPGTTYSQNFDAVAAPFLPTNWMSTVTPGMTNWVTVTNIADSASNSAFVPDVSSNGMSALYSPLFSIVSPTAQLIFRNNFNLENSPTVSTQAYDGGVLEISINGGAYLDIVYAGGSFASGGYNSVISDDYNNPLELRHCWSGNSGGFVTTVVNLPAAAAGQSVSFRWLLATDIGNSTIVTGWYIDTISVQDGAYSCCLASTDLGVSATNLPSSPIVGSNLVYTATITNLGPDTAASVVFTDVLPTNETLVSGPIGSVTNVNGNIVSVTVTIPFLASGSASNLTVTVIPTTTGPATNIFSVSSATQDYDTANNSYTSVVGANQPPYIIQQPINLMALEGTNATFSVTAGGTPQLGYQWLFNKAGISGATSNSLVLTNVQLTQIGNYSVVVTNLAGSVTSSVAVLTVLTPPKVIDGYTNDLTGLAITGMVRTTAGNRIYMRTQTGQKYTLQYKTNFTDTNWISEPPPVTGNGDVLLLQDTNGTPNVNRFYRVLIGQ